MFDWKLFPHVDFNKVNLDWVTDCLKALVGGTTNQILSKKSDNDFDFEWIDNTGGGSGGTTDYNELSNLPSINNVLLKNNKSFSQLGLTPAAIGAYVKPSTGIPASDLADDVIPNVDDKAPVIIDTAFGPVASFSDGADSIPVKNLTVGIEPVQSGSGDPSPDNVRPISGWTGAKVTRTGKNLFGGTIENGIWASGTYYVHGATSNRRSTPGKTAVKGGETYVVSFVNNTEYTIASVSCVTFSKGAWVTDMVKFSPPYTYTLDANVDEIAFNFVLGSSVSDITIENLQLELGSTATVYEPYAGDTYFITFPSEAGTVYGGTLDVTTGKLTVTHGHIASYAGESLPGEWISDRDVYSAGATPTTGAQVVYELATPIVYDLTPTEVNTLLGTNNVWADTGDSAVEYRADTKLYIDKKIASIASI